MFKRIEFSGIRFLDILNKEYGIVLNDIETQTGYALWPYILYLQDGSEALLETHWRMVQMGPEKHLGYAVQWFGLALTLVILYLYRIRQHSKTRHHKELDK